MNRSALLLAGFLASGSVPGAAQTSMAVDLTRLPIGDGRVSSSAEAGSVWACSTRFGGRGAQAGGDWLSGDGTFDLTAKPTVDGAVNWPARFSVSLNGAVRLIEGNDLPDHPTGVFPVARADDAFGFDRNPNRIAAQTLRFELPATPTVAASPSCVGMGPIGVLLTGGYVFNALDARGLDAVAHEIQDLCQGHPQQSGAYHYHSLTTCGEDDGAGHSALVGYALDGFGIFGRRGEGGESLTNADLDACHGHTHAIDWDGAVASMYHYHATWEYPYTIGCFRGRPVGAELEAEVAVEVEVEAAPVLSVITLGTGSPVYSAERSGPSTAIRVDNRFLLVDMGNGTQARMSEAGIALQEVDALLLTHHHRDHDEEFLPLVLLASLRGRPFLAGPPGTDRLVEFALDFYAEDLAYRAGNRGRAAPRPLTARDLEGGESFTVSGVEVTTARVEHSIHTVAYRFDSGDASIVVSGDLSYSPGLVELARGADVLVIDSGSLRTPRGSRAALDDRAHANLPEIAAMALESGTPCLVLTHFTRDEPDEAAVRVELAALYSGAIVFARDLMEISSDCRVGG